MRPKRFTQFAHIFCWFLMGTGAWFTYQALNDTELSKFVLSLGSETGNIFIASTWVMVLFGAGSLLIMIDPNTLPHWFWKSRWEPLLQLLVSIVGFVSTLTFLVVCWTGGIFQKFPAGWAFAILTLLAGLQIGITVFFWLMVTIRNHSRRSSHS